MKKAIQYYSKACDLKDGDGCFNLGYIYELNGYGVVKKDLKKAAQYYSKACELDNAGGCVILSTRGDELANKQEVFQYLSKACELNSGSGCFMLGGLYHHDREDLKKPFNTTLKRVI
nr:tetratricopeptide repeat protein [Helicobacter pylori]